MSAKRASPPEVEMVASGCGISTSNQLLSLISGKRTRDIKVVSDCPSFSFGPMAGMLQAKLSLAALGTHANNY